MNEATDTTSPDNLRHVLDRYPDLVAAGDDGLSVRLLPTGFGATTRLITTSGGRFLLRQLAHHTEQGRARFAAAIHHHAARAGLATRVLPDGTGEFVTSYAGQLFQLTRYAEGSCDPDTTPARELCHDLGHTLGRLHEVLHTAPAPSTAPRQTLPADPTTAIRAAYDVHDHPACGHADARRALAVKLRYAEALDPGLLIELAELPTQVIHGDFHLGNVIICQHAADGRHQTCVAIDFDLARIAPPGYELMRALVYCVRPAGPPAIFGPRIAAFLDGYLAAHQLSEREIDTMVTLYETVQLLDTHGLDSCRNAAPPLLRFGQARFALLYWMRRHAPYLSHLARQALSRLDQEEPR